MLFCENTSYVILGVTKIHFLFPKLGIVTSIKIFRNLHEDRLKVYSLQTGERRVVYHLILTLAGIHTDYFILCFQMAKQVQPSLRTSDRIFLGVKQGSFNHYFTIICDHMKVFSVVIKMQREQNTLCCTWKS